MNDFKYAMEREIYEQPDVISKLLNNYVSKDGKILFETPEKVRFIGGGSAGNGRAGRENRRV